MIEQEAVSTAEVERPVQRADERPKPQVKSGRVIQLDFVRGIAILAVMAYHFNRAAVQNPLARGFDFVSRRVGWSGVDLFFVLSGFLVGGLLVQELLKTDGLHVGRFLVRRTMKICRPITSTCCSRSWYDGIRSAPSRGRTF